MHMSVIRHILPVSKSVSCFCDISNCDHLKLLHCLECNCFAVNFFLGGGVSACWYCLY